MTILPLIKPVISTFYFFAYLITTYILPKVNSEESRAGEPKLPKNEARNDERLKCVRLKIFEVTSEFMDQQEQRTIKIKMYIM